MDLGCLYIREEIKQECRESMKTGGFGREDEEKKMTVLIHDSQHNYKKTRYINRLLII